MGIGSALIKPFVCLALSRGRIDGEQLIACGGFRAMIGVLLAATCTFFLAIVLAAGHACTNGASLSRFITS